MRAGVAGQSQDTHGPSDVPINYLAPYVDTIKDPVRRQLAAKLSVLCVKPSLRLSFRLPSQGSSERCLLDVQ